MKKITLTMFLLIALMSSQAATGWFNNFLTLDLSSTTSVTAPVTFWIGSDPASGIQLQGADLGTVDTLKITGCDMKYWSDTQDRTGGAFYYQIKSSDGATLVIAPVEVIWDHASIGGNDYQGTKATQINLLAGLKPATTYQLHVWAKSWGNGQGDSWLSNSGNNYVATFTTPAITITGANGIPDGTGYATLKAAFDALNAQTDQTSKDIEIAVGAGTTETATAALNQPAVSSWNSLTIYPTAVATIEGGFVGTILDLNGADKVTINGRLNKTGEGKSLTISHTSNADNSNRTIRFLNDAKENTIQYATIKGKCPSTGAGVIFFSTTTGTDGNDNNVIEYCDIDASGAAAVGIGSAGTADKANSGNIIRNNNIYDFYLGDASTTATYGLNIAAHNTAWTITGNSFYQKTPRAYTTSGNAFHYGLFISSATGAGGDFVITDNYIGGSAPMAGGSPWTVTGGQGRPVGLYTSFGTASPSSVQNNTITNFDITTDFVTNGSSAFIGYWHAAGSVNAGTVAGNTIGSSTAAGAIVVKYQGAAVGALTVGVNIVTAAAATMVFSNNKIGGILVDYLNTVNRGHLYAVSTSGAGALTFTNNIIGSETVANSIEHKGSTYTGGQVNLRGVSMGNVGVTALTGNIVANLTASSTATMAVNGIFHNGGGVNTISNNIIRDIKSAGTRVIATQGSDAGLIGIVLNSNSTGNTIGANTIYNLENTNTTEATDVYGINFHSINAGASTIEKNKIYNLSTASTNTAANVVGISITRGLTNTMNNAISLGNGISNAVSIVGIRKLSAAGSTSVPITIQNNNFYHNTVVISGSEVGTAGSSYTAAFAKITSATDDIKNNLFINNRSNATGNTQKHYTIFVNDLTTLTSDNNLLYADGNGGLTGAVGATDYAQLADWKNGTTLDAASVSKRVIFTGTNDLTISGTSLNDAELGAPRLATVLTDILGSSRATTTYMGAHEASDLTVPAPTKTFTVTVPNGTAKVYIAGSFTGKPWDITNPYELAPTANPNEFSGTFACAEGVEYKFLNEKGDWDYQEGIMDVDGITILMSVNRTYSATDNVPVWFNVNKVTFNATFATAVPNTLFVKGSFDGWASGREMTKSGSSFSYILGGNPGDKIAGNTQYKYYTNDMTNDNWEANADGSEKGNRLGIAPVMNDEVARFVTPLTTTGVDDAVNGIRIYRNANQVMIELSTPSDLEIFNLNGQLIDQQTATSKHSIQLNNGVYILKINGKARKITI